MAKQAKIEDIILPIFDGTEYSSWKFRLITLLEYKECNEQAMRQMTATDKETEWKKNDLKARNIIISTVSNKQLEYLTQCKTAFEMLNKFDSMYLTQSTALQIICRVKMEEIKLANYSSVEEFFVEFEKTVNDFKTAGGTINEAEKMRYLIRALPLEYSYIGDFIDIVPEEQRTVDYVKTKIKEKDMAKTNVQNKSRASTFFTKTQGKCYSCGQQGHYQKDCPRAQQSNGRGRDQYRGNVRGNSKGRFHRGRGRGRGQHSKSSSEQGNGLSETWSAQVCNTQVNEYNHDFSSTSSENLKIEINWLLDSGCTDHIVKSDNFFDKYVNLKVPIDVKLPDGKNSKATKLGNIKIVVKNYYGQKQIELKNVYYVEGFKQNLLSVSKITESCTIVSRNNSAKIYNNSRELVAVANKIDNLYYIKSFVLNMKNKNMKVNSVKLTDKEKWHRTLGHVNFQYLNKLVNSKLVEGLPDKLENVDMKCANCIESKMANVPFENNRSKTKEILELIHTDLNGPHSTTGYGGEKYFLTFIDDYSKCTRIFCIKNKSETANCFKEFVNLVENKFNKKIKKLRCDNGKEYLNKEIYDFIRDKGIELSPCPPYVHELNGVAERYNRSAMDTGRCLLREANIHRRYWPEIMKTVAYLKNRTIANTQENKTPFEIFFGKKPNVEHMKIYGSRVFVRVPENLRNSKWDNKAELGVLVGYTETGYRVLVNNRVINARHVQVVEDNVKLICLEKLDDEKDRANNNNDYGNDSENNYEKLESESDSEQNEINVIPNINPTSTQTFGESRSSQTNRNMPYNENNNDNSQLKDPRRSTRKKSPVNRYGNPVTHFIYVNYIDANVPNTFEEALNSSEHKQWNIAMDKEINSLKKNNTWQIVERPKNKKVIDVKWVYKRKNNNVYKARLVVRGFQQTEYIENVYSPVGKMQTLKILLSYSCKNNLFIDQMDVETAFLNGNVKSEVYINEPKGYETGDNKVCKLQKALYGLRESPRAWYDCFNEYVEKLNFVRSNYDYCLYVNNTSKDSIYILVFVDDLLICCKDQIKIKEVKTDLMKRFAMKDLGKISQYIGIDIDYSDDRSKMTLSQTKYIESLAQKYNLENTKLYDTPMESNLKLEQASEIDEQIKYRNLIGELLYISIGTRPDISYSINYLSRYQSCYDKTHFKYAMRVLKYLLKTKDLKLTYYTESESDILDCMVDSDYAGDNVDRKSTTGFIIRVYGNVIFWKTHKQSTVTKCSTFAEYTAMSEAVTEILFIRNLLCESFNVNFDKPIKMYEDNSGAIAIAKFGNFTKNSKHIEVQYHYINENYENGIIDIIKIDSQFNLADMLTKSLDKTKFQKNRKALRLI